MIQQGKANIIVGGQWGSEGKGKLAGYLYHNYPIIDIAVSDFTPNTGHTYIDEGGTKIISKIIPIGMAFESVKFILIGPHAVFSIKRFQEELEMFHKAGGKAKVIIHPMASVLTSADIKCELKSLNFIASTMQGSAAAQVTKIMRDTVQCNLAKDNKTLKPFLGETNVAIQHYLANGSTVLIETGQGFDLGLNYGYEWPFVTGRDCLLGRWLDNAGVHPKQLGSVIVALRAYPIRVGNTVGGYSGPYYTDQNIVNWEDLSNTLGYIVKEYTTVTNRLRRLFTWSNIQVKKMCMMIRPDYAFLNFVNYYRDDEFNIKIKQVNDLLTECNCKLKLIGTGAGLKDMTDLGVN